MTNKFFKISDQSGLIGLRSGLWIPDLNVATFELTIMLKSALYFFINKHLTLDIRDLTVNKRSLPMVVY